MIPCISVCLGQAYKPHFCESPIQGSLIPKFGPHGHCETPGSNGIQIYISKNFDRRKLRDVFHEIPQIGIDWVRLSYNINIHYIYDFAKAQKTQFFFLLLASWGIWGSLCLCFEEYALPSGLAIFRCNFVLYHLYVKHDFYFFFYSEMRDTHFNC